jgi:hypothetical protein
MWPWLEAETTPGVARNQAPRVEAESTCASAIYTFPLPRCRVALGILKRLGRKQVQVQSIFHKVQTNLIFEEPVRRGPAGEQVAAGSRAI